jgi:hypothetical protein
VTSYGAFRLAALATVLLAACSYNTSDFAVKDGSTGGDSGDQDSTVDDSNVDDTTLDDTGLETDDTALDDTADAGDSTHDAKDADTGDGADTTPFDTAACTEAGAIACGTPPACSLTKDDPLHCTSSPGCGIACDPTQYCQNGACACRPGLVSCGGTCIDIAGDETHCGGCPGTACTGSNHCGDGACTSGATCPSGRLKCLHSCWDVQGDPTHCGTTCSDIKVCTADQLCIGGACVTYKAAIGCSAVSGCDCTSILGTGARACPALTGSSDGVPICVDSTFCPAAPWN